MSNLMIVIKSRRSTRAFKSELPPKDLYQSTKVDTKNIIFKI